MNLKQEMNIGIESTNQRILKIEKIKNSMFNLRQNFIEYLDMKKSLLDKEKIIFKELEFFYSKNSSYEFLTKEFKKIFNLKKEIEEKEIKEGKINLVKLQDLENNFLEINKKTKDYIKSEKKLKYYKKKYTRLKNNSRNKDKILRNKVKFEYSEKLCNHFINEIKNESNSLNLSRFYFINPIIKNLFSFIISPNLILNKNFEKLEGFDKILFQMEKNDYNFRFFQLEEKKNYKINEDKNDKKFTNILAHKKNIFFNSFSGLKPFDDKISIVKNNENMDYFLKTLNSKKNYK